MKFADELYVGKTIYDTASVISLMKEGKTASGVFCAGTVCMQKGKWQIFL